MPSLSRVTDNLGLIFSTRKNQFIIEIWGEGIPNQSFNNTSDGVINSVTVVDNGAGGYTKLLMEIPESYTLQVRPNFYAGGTETIIGTGNVAPGTLVIPSSGGDAAGIAINDIWLAVTGGGGKASYTRSGFSFSSGGFFTSNFSASLVAAGGNGLGGYNLDDPLALPDVGGNSSASEFSNATDTTFNSSFSYEGSGGGGSPPGGSNPGGGGGANIRIWYEQNKLNGTLTSVPGVKMSYVDSADGINEGSPKVKITSVSTQKFIEYTTNQDVLVSDLLITLK